LACLYNAERVFFAIAKFLVQLRAEGVKADGEGDEERGWAMVGRGGKMALKCNIFGVMEMRNGGYRPRAMHFRKFY